MKQSCRVISKLNFGVFPEISYLGTLTIIITTMVAPSMDFSISKRFVTWDLELCLHDYFILQNYLNLKIVPTCMFIPYCTIIRYQRVVRFLLTHWINLMKTKQKKNWIICRKTTTFFACKVEEEAPIVLNSQGAIRIV